MEAIKSCRRFQRNGNVWKSSLIFAAVTLACVNSQGKENNIFVRDVILETALLIA